MNSPNTVFTIVPNDHLKPGQLICMSGFSGGCNGTYEIVSIARNEVTVHEATVWRLILDRVRGLRIELGWRIQDAWHELRDGIAELTRG